MGHDLGEHPPVYPKRIGFNNVIEFFLSGEVLGGYFNPTNETIGIYSFCPYMAEDLPYIEDVVFTIDHEFMHWLLYAFVDDWASTCFDDICRDMQHWIDGWEDYTEDLAHRFAIESIWWLDGVEVLFGLYGEMYSTYDFIIEWLME